MFADSETIYSHGTHFLIARWVAVPAYRPHRGHKVAAHDVVLFNSASYSVSTRQHQAHVRQALRGVATIYEVPRLYPSAASHADNLAHYAAKITAQANKAKRAVRHATYCVNDMDTLNEAAAAYAKTFRLRWKSPVDADTMAALRTRAESQEARSEEFRAKDLARDAAARALRAERSAEERIADRERDAEQFAKWQAGEPLAFCPAAYSTDDHGNAYLRRVGDTVHTSMGAEVPYAEAERAYRCLAGLRNNGMPYAPSPTMHRLAVGYFAIDSMDESGRIKAGCHYFAWDTAQAFFESPPVPSNGGGAGLRGMCDAAECENIAQPGFIDWAMPAHRVQTGILTPAGFTDTGAINPAACPHFIMVREHFDASGEHCRCADASHTDMAEWGYQWNGERWT
jgi:hypothetical protein